MDDPHFFQGLPVFPVLVSVDLRLVFHTEFVVAVAAVYRKFPGQGLYKPQRRFQFALPLCHHHVAADEDSVRPCGSYGLQQPPVTGTKLFIMKVC